MKRLNTEALKAKESQNMIENERKEIGDSVHIRGRSYRRDIQNKDHNRSRSKTRKLKYFLYHKQGHFKKKNVLIDINYKIKPKIREKYPLHKRTTTVLRCYLLQLQT